MDFLGTIVTVQNASRSNLSNAGGTAFSIPAKFTHVLIITPAGSAVTYAIRVGGGTATFVSDATQYTIGEQTSLQVKTPNNSPDATVVAIWAIGGTGNCKVFGLYDLAQS